MLPVFRMETDKIDMFLIHSPSSGKVVETYKALLDLKAKGHIRFVQTIEDDFY